MKSTIYTCPMPRTKASLVRDSALFIVILRALRILQF